MDANLRLINLDDFKIKGTTDVIIDFYPDRKFKRDIVVFLWKRESFGNIQFYKYFQNCDQKDIRVTILCVRNLFPIASQVGHRCIMNTASIQNCMSGSITKHGLERRRLWNEYIDFGTLNTGDIRKDFCIYVNSTDINDLITFYQDRPVLMDKKSYQLFEDIQDEFPKNAIWFEVKVLSQRFLETNVIKEAVDSCENAYGFDKNSQLSIIAKHDLNDHFLSMQILCSLKRSMRFIGIAGAGSLFLTTPLLNTVFIADAGDNISPAGLMFKTCFNEQIYGLRTLGGQYLHSHEFLSFKKSYLWDSFLSVINNKQKPIVPKLNVQDCSFPTLTHDFSRTIRGRGMLD